MTVHKAKKLLSEFLASEGLPYTKLTGKTVSFSDLARMSAIFVTVRGWVPSERADDVKEFAREHGFYVEFTTTQ